MVSDKIREQLIADGFDVSGISDSQLQRFSFAVWNNEVENIFLTHDETQLLLYALRDCKSSTEMKQYISSYIGRVINANVK